MDKAGNIAEDSLKIHLIARPVQTTLLQNYPNPFNAETWIPYQLKEGTGVTIEIYNAAGQLVRTLDLGFKSEGFYISKDKAAYWNGRNNLGEQTSSGIYFYTIQTSNFIATRKMLLLK